MNAPTTALLRGLWEDFTAPIRASWHRFNCRHEWEWSPELYAYECKHCDDIRSPHGC
jgi:hypothetical protein